MRKRTYGVRNKKKKYNRALTTSSTRLPPLRYGNISSYSQLTKGLLGKRFRTKLIYMDRGRTVNPGAGGLAASYVFSANGIWDPNITGVGHQPTGFDQFMSFYDHYCVVSSKIYVHFKNFDNTLDQMVGIYVSDRASVESDYRNIIENGMGTYSIVGNVNDTNNAMELAQAVSIARFLGRPNVLDEDNLQGSGGTNPADQAYFHVWAAPTIAADSGSVEINVRVEYVVEFKEPKILPTS